MTDDNLRHWEKILPMEKAQSLKMQVKAISHQGTRLEGVGKCSTEIVGERNGMNYKQVQRYIRLTELVPELQSMVNEKKMSFTPAVEISFIKPKTRGLSPFLLRVSSPPPRCPRPRSSAGWIRTGNGTAM